MKNIFCLLKLSILTVAFALRSDAAQVRILPADFADAKQPQVATDAHGNIFVAFGKDNSIYVSKSSDEGNTFQSPKKIVTLGKLALGMRRGPRLVAREKFVAVSAVSNAEGNLYSWISQDEGRTWSAPAKINDVSKSAREGLHGMAGNENGLLFCVWLDLRNQQTELWGARSLDGGKSWETNAKIYESPDKSICQCCHPSVAVRDDGEIVVMWRNSLNGNRDMYEARSDDKGKTFGAACKLGKGGWPLNGCPMDGGSLLISSNQIAALWRRENQIYFTSTNAVETQISDNGIQPVLFQTKTGMEFLWQNGGNLYRKKNISSKTDLFARNAAYASAAWSPVLRKSFIVWESDGTIFYTADE